MMSQAQNLLTSIEVIIVVKGLIKCGALIYAVYRYEFDDMSVRDGWREV